MVIATGAPVRATSAKRAFKVALASVLVMVLYCTLPSVVRNGLIGLVVLGRYVLAEIGVSDRVNLLHRQPRPAARFVCQSAGL